MNHGSSLHLWPGLDPEQCKPPLSRYHGDKRPLPWSIHPDTPPLEGKFQVSEIRHLQFLYVGDVTPLHHEVLLCDGDDAWWHFWRRIGLLVEEVQRPLNVLRDQERCAPTFWRDCWLEASRCEYLISVLASLPSTVVAWWCPWSSFPATQGFGWIAPPTLPLIAVVGWDRDGKPKSRLWYQIATISLSITGSW